MEENPETKNSSKFRVNRDLINSVDKVDQGLELQTLDITVYDHSTLERGIIDQVKVALKGADSSETEEGEISNEEPNTSQLKKFDKNNDSRYTNLTESIIEKYLKEQSELAEYSRRLAKAHWKSILQIVPEEKISESIPSYEDDIVDEKRTKAPVSKSPQKRKKKLASPQKSKKKKSMGDDELTDEENVSEESASGSEYDPNEDFPSDDEISPRRNRKKNQTVRRQKSQSDDDSESCYGSTDDELNQRKSKKELDDGNLDIYIRRTKSLPILDKDDCVSLDLHFRLPTYIWQKLFLYQQNGVKWMWGLHKDAFGGILGDEMGLGKTIQMISFLAGLHFSNEKDLDSGFIGLGPSIIVCPTTIMHQWVREFHSWYPQIRVAILHESGTFSGKSRRQLIKSITSKTIGILITSYSGLIQSKDIILSCSWHYVILDEGHKIRNPDAQVTTVCKNFDTCHKIILSGSPMQNNLKELWSLFDFIIPGKLGSLNVFTSSFVTPIVHGGYVNATKAQVLTAFKCATVLRDTIKPFLLRRSKTEVDIQLPEKKEQVLFCKLTDDQREAYQAFLKSLDLDYVQNNKGRLFGALITLRKICNHPDLYTAGFHDHFIVRDTLFETEKGSEDDYGYWKRSGKLIVLVSLLKHWHKIGGQKVLVFTQGKKMMLVLENFIKRSGYKYLKLDGGISIAARQPLIDKFNQDSSYFIMLLTTRVGGLGVNLTGANKVVIYDPDWNPATDAQARERAWRIGQSKNVCIYRLLTTGTIEEKMYHRQIYKEFLSNKILKDPKQRRFFKSSDLMELFTLNETVQGGTVETAAIFAGTGSEIKYNSKVAAKASLKKASLTSQIKKSFSKKKLEAMRKLAHEMSKRVGDLSFKNKLLTSGAEHPDKPPAQLLNCSEDIYGPDGQLIPNALDMIRKDETGKENDSPDKSELNENEENLSDLRINQDPSVIPCDSELVNSCDASTSDTNIKEKNDESQDVYSDVQDESRHESDYEMSFEDILNSNKNKQRVIETKDDSVPCKEKKLQTKVKYKDKLSDKGKSEKNKSKKSSRSKKSGFAKFEGEIVPHLVKCRQVKKKKEEEEEEMIANHDDYILHKLLKKSGIDTAMKHDSIMEKGPSDYAIVEEEASRVAENALNAIQRSYNESRLPDTQSKNPLMQEIMNRLREGNLQGFTGGPQAKALLTELIKFLNSMGGTASTNQLVDNFREKVDSGKSPIFKKLLSNIATFYRAPDSKGYWTIKDDFKSIAL